MRSLRASLQVDMKTLLHHIDNITPREQGTGYILHLVHVSLPTGEANAVLHHINAMSHAHNKLSTLYIMIACYTRVL